MKPFGVRRFIGALDRRDSSRRIPVSHVGGATSRPVKSGDKSPHSKTKPRIAGVVLAGGKSSRFGRDKSQLVLGGKSIVQAQLEKLAKAGCAPLFVVAHTTQRSDAPTLRRSVTILHDLHPNLGPIGGLHAALKHISVAQASLPVVNAVLLLACDMPLVSVALLRRLANSPIRRFDCTVPTHDGQLEPLCAVYSGKILAVVENRIHQFVGASPASERAMNRATTNLLAMHDLVQSLTTQFLDVSTLANCEREFYNVNRPEDYERIRRKP